MKANVIILPKGRPTEAVWIFDARSNVPGITEKERPLAPPQAAALDRMEEQSVAYRTVHLRACGISEAQAADLRARLRTFAEDWEHPEAAIYDEDPTR